MSEAVFDDIYRRNAWNGKESLSGPGSGSAPTHRIVFALLELVSELDIKSVLDVACGDGFWMPDLPGYIGLDLSSEAIDLAKQRHPDRVYDQGDVRTYAIPKVDLIIFRDVMQHMSLADGLDSLSAIRRAEPKWALISTYIDSENYDITPQVVHSGMGYCPDLTREPFNMPPPERYIADGWEWEWENSDKVRDPKKMLGLWGLERVTSSARSKALYT